MVTTTRRDAYRIHWQVAGAILVFFAISSTVWYLFGALDTINLISAQSFGQHSMPSTTLESEGPTTTNPDLPDPTIPSDETKLSRMVVTAHYHENVEWTKYLGEIPVTLVEKDNPLNPDNVGSNNMTESTSYLYYMIKYYDTLPDVVAFVHGHGDPRVLNETVWTTKQYQAIPHPETLQTANTLHEQEGGPLVWPGKANPVPLWPGDPMGGLDGSRYQRAYHTLFKWLQLDWSEGGMGIELPHFITTQCCSAFSVDRDTIRSVPKDRLERLFEYLESGINIDMGITMEYVWILLFNKKDWN